MHDQQPGLRSLDTVRATLHGIAQDLDGCTVPLDHAKAALALVVTIKNLAATLEGRLARRITGTKEWERAGFPSAEAWLAKQTGAPLGRARDTLEAAERLEGLPAVTDAANCGDLSPEQAAMIADAATADPSAQQRLLGSAASKPLSRLRDECAAVKRAADPDPEAAHRRLHQARHLRFSRALDGAAKLFGATTPEQLAVIKAAVERRGDELFDRARRAGRHEPRDAYLMDALAEICDEWLRGQAAGPLDDRAPTTDADPATPAHTTKRPLAPGYLGILRLDLDALQRGRVEGDELCEIAGLGPVPVSAARQLLGDSVLKLVLTRGVDVANVTHLGRGPTAAQKIAMLWGSPGCVVSGCARMAGIEHDHRIDWARTHHTRIDELDRLCTHHHDLKTHQSWALVTETEGVVEMVPPSDPRHPDRRSRGPTHERPGEPRRQNPDGTGPDPPTGGPPAGSCPHGRLFAG